MSRIYNTDIAADLEALKEMRVKAGLPREFKEVKERRTKYGEPAAYEAGLIPLDDVPDVLIPKDSIEDAIEESHILQTLPMYHMHYTWRPVGFRYNQNGLGYCWTWSGTGCMMTCRALEDKDTVLLAPVSMGYLVGWGNRGNYLESYIKGAREDGVCSVPEGEDINSTNRSSSFWEQHKGTRKLYRLDKVWDVNTRSGDSTTLQHCASILSYGRSIYIAYNWWGHALELAGLKMVNGVWQWIINNSHNEDDFIILTGSKAVPDEGYGFISTVAT